MLIKLLAPEDGSDRARALVSAAEELLAPAFAWAEVGSALRKKRRSGSLSADVAAELWQSFLELGVVFVHSDALAGRSWELAERFTLPTLYDAAFLALSELSAPCEFWTADQALLAALGDRAGYVRDLYNSPI